MHKVSPMVARKYAVTMHSSINQKYGKHPYSYHLDRAVEVLERWNRWNGMKGIANSGFLATCLYLHDVREDVEVPHEDIVEMFGEDVADVVDCMTRREAETLDEYLARIKTDIRAVLCKICDSSTNLQHSIFQMSPVRVAKYTRILVELTEHVAGFLAPNRPETVSDAA